MRIDILTLFPEMCLSVLNESIIGRARESGNVTIECRNIRDYTLDKHNRVDDAPYGGGTGMIMQAQPIYDCFESLCSQLGARPHLVYMSPKGKVLTQAKAKELSQLENIAILCGHYEGVDERVIEEIVDEEISLGDYVITGGELPALILADCISRMLPGVLPNEDAYTLESHYSGLLEYPQYTRPFEWHGKTVPEVLISGHHANIQKWQREKSLEVTLAKRPDLLRDAELSKQDKAYLASLETDNK
jgi:tRNA (guanine37-N1)-methyltransferase